MATRTYRIVPVQAADAAIPADHHIAPILLGVDPGDVLELQWMDVTDVSELLADATGLTVGLLSGSCRFEEGVLVGDEERVDAPANMTIHGETLAQFEPIGERCVIQVYGYVHDTDGVSEYVPEA